MLELKLKKGDKATGDALHARSKVANRGRLGGPMPQKVRLPPSPDWAIHVYARLSRANSVVGIYTSGHARCLAPEDTTKVPRALSSHSFS